jgi:hypothetical protein
MSSIATNPNPHIKQPVNRQGTAQKTHANQPANRGAKQALAKTKKPQTKQPASRQETAQNKNENARKKTPIARKRPGNGA